MSIRTAAVLLATAALAVPALVPATAGAHTDLRLDPGDVPLPPPTTFTSTSSHGFFLNAPGTGQLGCTNASFDADVSSITSATSIAGQLTAFTAQGCTDSFAINFTACHLHNKVGLHVTSTVTGGTVTLTDPVLRCATTTPGVCYFTAATAVGVYTNATSALAFENVPYIRVAPTSDGLPATSCGNGGTWSVTFTHLVGGTANQTLTIRQ
jgi:hypothetical protein